MTPVQIGPKNDPKSFFHNAVIPEIQNRVPGTGFFNKLLMLKPSIKQICRRLVRFGDLPGRSPEAENK
jgi:hypothetical protein